MREAHPARHPRALPAAAVVLSFIDCINRLDLDGLVDLMTEDHELRILDETPVVGRESNARAWRGYFDAFSRTSSTRSTSPTTATWSPSSGPRPARTSTCRTRRSESSLCSGSRRHERDGWRPGRSLTTRRKLVRPLV